MKMSKFKAWYWVLNCLHDAEIERSTRNGLHWVAFARNGETLARAETLAGIREQLICRYRRVHCNFWINSDTEFE